MRDIHLFQLALGIDSPWFVSASDFDAEGNGSTSRPTSRVALAEPDLSALKRVSINETAVRRGHNSDASRTKEVCIDMSGAYIAGVSENLTEAEITFDKFHVMTLIGDAVDKVRRDETKSRPELKASRYLWLKNDAKLSARQSQPENRMRVGHAAHVPGHLQGTEQAVG